MTGGKLESGCYYLTDDLALEEPLCVPKNGAQVTLCLNGHTIRLADGAEGCIIFVAVSDKDAEPSLLTITDCNGADSSSNYYVDEDGALVFDDGSYAWQEAYIAASEKNALAGGRITGATAGAISVGDYNELYLTNVNIIDNAGRYGAGVVVAEHASAVLDSCVIAGNRLTGEMKASEKQILGGGVYCAGTLELSGTTSITGNRAQDAQDNLWLDETAALKIGDLGLDKQAHIGVSGAAEQTILTGYADDFSENFTSDDLTLTIAAARKNGFTELSLQEAVYTLTLDTGEDSEPVTLEAEQGKSLHELNVQAPERENMTFDGWYTEEGDCVDAEAPLHLTGDTTLSARWTQAEPQSAEAALLTYDPDAPITKQEAAKTLYQMARQLGLDTEAGQEVDLTQFEDADEISDRKGREAPCCRRVDPEGADPDAGGFSGSDLSAALLPHQKHTEQHQKRENDGGEDACAERSAAGVRDEARKRRASRAAKITRQRQQREHLCPAAPDGSGCTAERSGPENADREAAHGAAKQAQNRRRHEHDAQIRPDAQRRADSHTAA